MQNSPVSSIKLFPAWPKDASILASLLIDNRTHGNAMQEVPVAEVDEELRIAMFSSLSDEHNIPELCLSVQNKLDLWRTGNKHKILAGTLRIVDIMPPTFHMCPWPGSLCSVVAVTVKYKGEALSLTPEQALAI
jgi:hypothetical protein